MNNINQNIKNKCKRNIYVNFNGILFNVVPNNKIFNRYLENPKYDTNVFN